VVVPDHSWTAGKREDILDDGGTDKRYDQQSKNDRRAAR
jgi:hypothetical protein